MIKRFFTCVLTAVMLFSVCSFAYADVPIVTIESSTISYSEIDGKLDMSVKVDTTEQLYLVSIEGSDSISGASFSPDFESNRLIVPAGQSPLHFNATLSPSAVDKGQVTFHFFYIKDGKSKYEPIPFEFSITRSTSPTPSEPAAPDSPEQKTEEQTPNNEFFFRASTVDPNGLMVETPSGDYGERLFIRLPLLCTGGPVYDVSIKPVLSTDIEKFPFDIEMVDYSLYYNNTVSKGQVIEFQYNWALSKKATTGVKQVEFDVSYRTGMSGELKTGKVSLFINVRKGLDPKSAEKDETASVPKLIIDSYSLSSDKIYAGETFDLNFTVRNTSSKEDVHNVQIRIKDAAETATVVPASGGSNTLYIDKIGKGKTSEHKLSFQTPPDATAKAYTLNLDFSYESASTNAAHTAAETIAVPILQMIRLKCDDPTIYDETAFVDSPASMFIKMYNMGRSTVYNCMVDVEGQGLKMEESFFGGNIASGSTMNADFSVIPSVAGTISGTIVISYEDVYGEPGEERLPFTINVEEMVNPEDYMIENVTPEEPERKGLPGWVYAVIGAGVLSGGGFFGIKALKKRRARSLEDDI